MRKAIVESGVALLVGAMSILGFREAWGYSGEGGLMPRGVTAFMIVLSAIWFAQSVKAVSEGAAERIAPTPEQIRAAGLLVLAAAALLLGMQYIGFYTSAAIVVPLLGYGLGYRKLQGLALATALFLLLLIAVFRLLLAVPLPPEALLKLIGV